MKETIILLYFLQTDYGVNDRERTSDVADGDREPADCCFDR